MHLLCMKYHGRPPPSPSPILLQWLIAASIQVETLIDSVKTNNFCLKNLKFTPPGCRNIGIRCDTDSYPF